MRATKFIAFAVVPFLPFALSACSLDAKSTSTGASGANERLQRKPPRGRVEAGTTKILKESGSFESLDLSDNQYRKMGECMTGRLYDQATAFTLNGLASGKQDFQIAVKDRQILEKAATECAGQASAQIADPDKNADPDKSTNPNKNADPDKSTNPNKGTDPDKSTNPSSTDGPNQDSNSSRQ